MSEQTQYAVNLHCEKCGQDGTAAWEREVSTAHPNRLVLIRLSDGFYERVSKKARDRIEIVCNSCGQIILNDSTLAAEHVARRMIGG